jgi:hypothetical protein
MPIIAGTDLAINCVTSLLSAKKSNIPLIIIILS